MRQVVYAMRFEGRADPLGPDGKVLKATAASPSTAVTSAVGRDGLDGRVEAIVGDRATFESEMTFTGRNAYLEHGWIAFGNRHRLHFVTVGSGYLGPGPDPTRQHGSATWRIEGGDGQFADASGLITSNLIVGPEDGITSHHCGVIFLP
ncbi:MAG: hypothetical protein QOF33_2751 [Thermomicrobiales bacterium]|jgi:hypothetical protein|nr:hypothetical protein [Thermomicrobiales bacterium]MEA2524639.1 hypothetical protein [Thermomicrobiales bacterium]MEA2584666.1 hypothetical protein [Thermomicrobiales bacterium]